MLREANSGEKIGTKELNRGETHSGNNPIIDVEWVLPVRTAHNKTPLPNLIIKSTYLSTQSNSVQLWPVLRQKKIRF